jgi:peptidoglycan/LPS O-acetylase OafA/YrhL
LDGVRGIACLLVVIWHLFAALLTQDFVPFSPQLTRLISTLLVGSVDLFFVLSGFLIGGVLLDSSAAPNFFRVFWARRAARILPAYIMLFLAYWAALAMRPYADASWLNDWLLRSPLPFWTYATFTQNYAMAISADPGAFWVGITWSLAVEEQFYLCFPVLVYLLRRSTLVWLALCCIVAAAFIRIHLWKVSGAFYSGYFPTPARVDSLMFGFLVACAVRDETILRLAKTCRPALDVVAVAILLVIVEHSVLDRWQTLAFTLMALVYAYGILRIFIVEGGPYRALLRTPLLVGAGLISYAWYLYHQAMNGLMHGLLFGQAPVIASHRDWTAAILALVLSAALATVSTLWLELPIRNAVGRRMRYVRQEHSPDVPRGVPALKIDLV